MARTGRKFGTMSALALALMGGTALVVLPALAQESLLPEGFGDPAPKGGTPKSAPAPKSTPTPSPPRGESGSGGSLSGGSGTSGSTSGNVAAPGPGSSATDEDIADDEDDAEDEEPGQIRYDLPPGSRRLLTRVGPLTPETGGLGPEAFGGTGGHYLTQLLRNTRTPLASRWGAILLRRTLLSAVDTPRTINGADLVAERAAMLLKMGEAAAARNLVQEVDHDRATPRLLQIALQTYLANADPAGLCPYSARGRATGDPSWQLADGMCSALTGAPGPAGSAVDRVRSSGKLSAIDVLLAERVLGAAINGRRSIKIEWDGVDRLSSWRFGLATATATEVPAKLRQEAPGYMQSWTVLAPMTPVAARVEAAPVAAARGVLSNSAYVSLVAAAADDEDATDAVRDLADELRTAFAGTDSAARLTAMRGIWNAASSDSEARYAALVLTAQAAAALPVSAASGADADMVVASMLAGGYDRNALAWVPTVEIGSRAWGMLAVGLPRQLAGVDGDDIDRFADDDDSADQHRSKLLVAALAGLGRIDGETAAASAGDLSMTLGTATRWTRAIDAAAARGEQGTVAVLAAVGMQGNDWSKMPPYHLFHIVRALRQVGLASEARMIAAEALARV